jgi:hypothetical protein
MVRASRSNKPGLLEPYRTFSVEWEHPICKRCYDSAQTRLSADILACVYGLMFVSAWLHCGRISILTGVFVSGVVAAAVCATIVVWPADLLLQIGAQTVNGLSNKKGRARGRAT